MHNEQFAKGTNVPNTDTISRQAAIDALTGIEFCHYMEFGEYIGENTREVRLIRAEKAQDALQNLSSAQPDIVCKDCKWCEERYDSIDKTPYWMCKNWDSQADADGFCYKAERRTNG